MLLSDMGDLGQAMPTSAAWDADQIFETANSTMVVGPLTIKGTSRVADDSSVARSPSPGSTILDKVLPIKTDASGKAKIFGLPPALVYALAGIAVVGASYYGYRALSGRRRFVTNPSKRRRRGRAKRRAKR